ncbi:MAG: hypothetical protein HC822_22660 [Oscillochloris sp.]|nr:hypothetical protein [Oscillochloris sp.]
MKLSAGTANQHRTHTFNRPSAPLIAAGAVILATLLLMLLGGQFAQSGMALRADNPQAARALVRFHNLERNEQGAFRWSQPLAAIFIYGFEGRPAVLSLRLTAPRPPGEPTPTVTLGDPDPTSFSVGPDWRRYHLLVPTDPGGETALRMLTTPAFVPPGDPRELGVVLSELRAAPLAVGATSLPVRSIYLFSLPLIGWLLARRLGFGPWRALWPGLALAAITGLASAFPTEFGYWLPTLGWPWWPILPLTLLPAAPAVGRWLQRGRTWLNTQPALGWAGLVLALLALLAIRAEIPALLAGAAAVVGIWAGRSVLIHEPDTAISRPMIVWGMVGSIAIALLLRLINLGDQPAGLWRDESRHALQALRIWEDPTYRPIYVVAGADLPALLFYLMAPMVGIFGPQAWDARLVSALAGAFTRSHYSGLWPR